MLDYIKKLLSILSEKDKTFLPLLLILSLITSIIETVSISLIMPFMYFASNPSEIEHHKYINILYQYTHSLGINSPSSFIILGGFLLISFYMFRGIYGLWFAYIMAKFSSESFQFIACQLFRNYMTLPYAEFANRNAALMIKTIAAEAGYASTLLQNSLQFVTEIVTILFIYSLLLFIKWEVTLVMTLLISSIVLVISRVVSRKVKQEGAKRADFQNQFFRLLNESFGNFKIIKILSNESSILASFNKISVGIASTNTNSIALGMILKSSLEVFGFTMIIAVLMIVVYYNYNITLIFPIIAAYTLAMFRVLPGLNRVSTSYNQIQFYKNSLDIILADIHFKIREEGENPVRFNESIELKDVSFNYDNKEDILKNINLTISKGSKTAFIGESGSGKSTLIDIIIGIFEPRQGHIYVDGVPLQHDNIKSWRNKVGYIPQAIYLYDGTIADNVTFGHEFDEQKVIEVLKKTNLYDFFLDQDGIYTRVGDNGIKLSGGQKQRIGIARALYNNPEILVLDEATSALDTETEAQIMEEIYTIIQGKTLLIIAHRLSTIQKCEVVYRVGNGNISYEIE